MIATKSGEKVNVLVVEDEAPIREALVEFLRHMDVFNHIIEAADGQEAIRKYRNQEFDMVVTDLVMPKANGIELIKAIKEFHKKNPNRPNCSIVILSGNITDIEVKKAVQLGVKHALTKPCMSDEFIQKIKQVLVQEHPKKIVQQAS